MADKYTIEITSKPSYTVEIANKGVRGKASTMVVGSTTTVDPSTPASVVNVGTANDAILNFYIPKGDTGVSTGDMLTSVYDEEGGAKQVAFKDSVDALSNTVSSLSGYMNYKMDLVPDSTGYFLYADANGQAVGASNFTTFDVLQLTKQGNTFNGVSQLVKTNASGQLPAIDGSLLTGISGGGVNIFDNKGTVTTNITLAENKITTGHWSGTNTITLPTVTDIAKQVTCELWFTTATATQPTITNTNLKWDKSNNGHAPTSYSTSSSVVNVLIFKSYWEGSTLKWATEYKTNGAVETDFVRPYLTTNGTMGGASVAVSATTERASYPAWQGSDSSTATTFQFTSTSGDFIYYVPNAVKAEQLYILDNTSISTPCVQSMNIYASKNGSVYTYLTSYTHVNGGSFITIPAELRDYWNYFKLSISSPSVSYAGFFDFYPIGKYIVI
jgi:hypothetical protein